ncbi:MAG: agmatine deiminase family protein [Muribaculaceae bacterium]|nr:agmatine deiminase family protein [Muribaculaceae bacterium]
MTQHSSLRLPAEWESTGAILLSWPHKDSDWAYMLEEVTQCFINIVTEIIKEEYAIIVAPDISIPQEQLSHLSQDNIRYVEIPTDDTWARDFGPITTINNDEYIINDFQFNGWGLKFRSCNDNLITSNLMKWEALKGRVNNLLGFTLEGGSVESDGRGLMLTTSECLLSPNRNGDLDKQQIEDVLARELGISKTLWLDFGYLAGDDTDSHIDTLARICPNDTIAYVGCNDETDEHYEELQAMKQQLQQFTTIDNRPFNLVELPWPDAIYDEDGERLPATYANFLILKDSVLMPSYKQPANDKLAMEQLAKAFPGYKITAVDCNALIKQHGSLHCVTMQLPAEILNI